MTISYTKEDLKALVTFIADGSPISSILEDCDYDPEEFSSHIKVLKKEWEFVYNTPLSSLPLTMGDPRYEGWRRWRFSIGK